MKFWNSKIKRVSLIGFTIKIDKLQLILTLLILLAAILLFGTNTTDRRSNPLTYSENAINPPVAARKSHLWDIWGEKHDDPYYWLRDKNQEVLDYLEAENKYRQGNLSYLERLEDLLCAMNSLFVQIQMWSQNKSRLPIKSTKSCYLASKKLT